MRVHRLGQVARGRAHLDYGRSNGSNEPDVWVGGARALRVVIDVEEISGRRVS